MKGRKKRKKLEKKKKKKRREGKGWRKSLLKKKINN